LTFSLIHTLSLSLFVALAAGLSHPLLIYLLFSYQQKLVPGAWDEERRGREVVTGTTAALRRSSGVPISL